MQAVDCTFREGLSLFTKKLAACFLFSLPFVPQFTYVHREPLNEDNVTVFRVNLWLRAVVFAAFARPCAAYSSWKNEIPLCRMFPELVGLNR
jgi:hypothetical protein